MTANTKLVGKTLTELLQGYDVAKTIPQINVLDIANSSQQVIAGSLFVALQGVTSHGIDFAIDAVKAGAISLTIDIPLETARYHLDTTLRPRDVFFALAAFVAIYLCPLSRALSLAFILIW